jgi:hypothetical protein
MPRAKSARKPNAALMKPVQKDMGLHQEKQTSGRKEKNADQC